MILPEFNRILVIRRDNIGDLLLTTPLLTALRRRYPQARLAVLAHAYNAPVLVGNPDLDAVYTYVKGKHADTGRLSALIRQGALYYRLRREGFDLIVHANPTVHPRTARLVRFLAAPWRLGVGLDDRSGFNLPVAEADLDGPHHARRVFSLLRPWGSRDHPAP